MYAYGIKTENNKPNCMIKKPEQCEGITPAEDKQTIPKK